MARRVKSNPDVDIESVGLAVATRFDALPWEDFSHFDKSRRDAVRSEIFVIRRDLMTVGAVDMRKAANIWDAHVPSFVPRPLEFPDREPSGVPVNAIEPGRRKRKLSRDPWLDAPNEDPRRVATPDRDERQKTEPAITVFVRQSDLATNEDQDDRAARQRALLDGLDKQYLRASDRYHFRDRSGDVAFEARTKRLITSHETPAVVGSMIDLAEARGWETLKVSGTAPFRREAWLQASMRDLAVTGYRPTALDRARLDEMRKEFGQNKQRKAAVPGLDAAKPEKAYDGSDPIEAASKSEPRAPLSASQRSVIDALEKTMRARGDSDEAIRAARDVAAQKLGQGRVHVGKLVQKGSAPYQDKPGQPQSHFVVLEDDSGRRDKVWGVDLPRAIETGKVALGDKVALAFRGRQAVTVSVRVPSEDGKRVQIEDRLVERNTWEAVKFDRLRATIREKLDPPRSVAPPRARDDRSASPTSRTRPSARERQR